MSEFVIIQCGLDGQLYVALGMLIGIGLGSVLTLIIKYVMGKE